MSGHCRLEFMTPSGRSHVLPPWTFSFLHNSLFIGFCGIKSPLVILASLLLKGKLGLLIREWAILLWLMLLNHSFYRYWNILELFPPPPMPHSAICCASPFTTRLGFLLWAVGERAASDTLIECRPPPTAPGFVVELQHYR